MKRFKIVLAIVAVLVVLGTVIAIAAKPAADSVNGAKQISLSILGSKATCSATASFAGKTIEANLVLRKGDTVVASWHKSGRNAVAFSETAEVKESGQYTLTLSGTAGGISFTTKSVEKTVVIDEPEKPAGPKPEEKKDEPAPKTEPEPDKEETQKPAETGKKKEGKPSDPVKNTAENSGDTGKKETEKSDPPVEKQEPAQKTKAEEKLSVEMRPEVNYPVIRVRNPYRVVGLALNNAIVINNRKSLEDHFVLPQDASEDDSMFGSYVKLIEKYDDNWFETHQILAFSLPNESGPTFTRRVVSVSGAPSNSIEIDQYIEGGYYVVGFGPMIYFVELGKLYEDGVNVNVIVNNIIIE